MPLLLIYRLLFVAELFLAEFLFAFRLRKRSFFALRFFACMAVTAALAALLPLHYNAFYTCVTFLLIFSVTVPMMKFCCNENWKNVFFIGVAAYTMQHFAYGVANMFMTLIEMGRSPILGMYSEGIFNLSKLNLNTLFIAVVYIFAYFISYTSLFLIFGKKIRRGDDFKVKSFNIMILVGVMLLVDIFLNSVIIYYNDSDSVVSSVMTVIYENICCFFLLHVQFELVKTGELESELTLTRYLLREKERQYKISKDNIDLINVKCHDLRHQIRVIGEGKGLPDEVVKEIRNSISIYDSAVRTDNETLDIILTEKSLRCNASNITLTCIADGHALDSMEKIDVYSLFGNALDNAIEAVMPLKEELRNIGVMVRSVGDIISINIYNNFEGVLVLDGDGFPVTAKSDRGYHGFGLKSIRQIAEKYGGVCTVTGADSVFSLKIIMSKGAPQKVIA